MNIHVPSIIGSVGLLLVIITLFAPVAFAQIGFCTDSIPPICTFEETDEQTRKSAGITPDHPLYFLDIAIERISLLLATSPIEKARIGLEHAEERLSEVKLMIDANKAKHADIAQRHHDDILKEIESRIGDIDTRSEPSEEKLARIIEIEERLALHSDRIKVISENTILKIRTSGNVPLEQINLITTILDRVKASTNVATIMVKAEAVTAQERIREETGKTEFQVQRISDQLKLDFRQQLRDTHFIKTSGFNFDSVRITETDSRNQLNFDFLYSSTDDSVSTDTRQTGSSSSGG